MSDTINRGKTTAASTPGSFAPHTRSDAEVGLGVDECARHDGIPAVERGLCQRCLDEQRWGSVDAPKLGSPIQGWGRVNEIYDLAPGVIFASCEGHGGVKLSPERNAVIPPPLRRSNRWYEEDCEVSIVGMYHPDIEWSSKASTEEFEREVKQWFPDDWEKATGGVIQPGESRARDEALWRAEHHGDFITSSARKSRIDPDLLVITARREPDGEREEFLVPSAEYATRKDNPSGLFVVDPSRHAKLPPAAERGSGRDEGPAPVRVRSDSLSSSALSQAYIDGSITGATRDRVEKDLGQRWRLQDGSVKTLRDILHDEDVVKTAYEENGKMTYAVIRAGGSSLRISKAAFDYLEAPDDRSPARAARQRASVAYEGARRKLENAWSQGEREKARTSLKAAERLLEEAEALRLAERREYEAKHGDAQQQVAAIEAEELRREQQAQRTFSA